MTMDDTVAGKIIKLNDAGLSSSFWPVLPSLDNSVDDMDDTVAGQDIKLDDAGQSSPLSRQQFG